MGLRQVGRVALGASLVFAGISHLTFAREGFRAQVPPEVPLDEDATVLLSGIVEVALGSALVTATPERRRLVGDVAAAFFVAIFPGNLAQWALRRSSLGLDTDEKRFVRLLFQPALVAAALWTTRR